MPLHCVWETKVVNFLSVLAREEDHADKLMQTTRQQPNNKQSAHQKKGKQGNIGPLEQRMQKECNVATQGDALRPTF